jgi:hypothetical protein
LYIMQNTQKLPDLKSTFAYKVANKKIIVRM